MSSVEFYKKLGRVTSNLLGSPSPLLRRCEKIRLGLFPVIPAEALHRMVYRAEALHRMVYRAEALHRMVYRAEAGIQYFQAFKNCLDPGFYRSDN